MKKLIKKLLPANFKQDMKDHLGVPSLSALLKHLKKIGYTPTVVYDIGAYEGYWAMDFRRVFPKSEIYMFEAQQSKEPLLRSRCNADARLKYSISLLGAEANIPVWFDESETGSHVDQHAAPQSHNRITDRLDDLVKRNGYPLPDFLKLDVQGYELEVLKGGSSVLEHAEFCLLEVSLLDLGGGGPLLNDVVNFMDAKGFCAYDISQFIRRPLDKALWQIDMVFVKKSSRYISEKRWK